MRKTTTLPFSLVVMLVVLSSEVNDKEDNEDESDIDEGRGGYTEKDMKGSVV